MLDGTFSDTGGSLTVARGPGIGTQTVSAILHIPATPLVFTAKYHESYASLTESRGRDSKEGRIAKTERKAETDADKGMVIRERKRKKAAS